MKRDSKKFQACLIALCEMLAADMRETGDDTSAAKIENLIACNQNNMITNRELLLSAVKEEHRSESDYSIEKTPFYHLYKSNRRFYVDYYETIAHSYDTEEHAREAIYYHFN